MARASQGVLETGSKVLEGGWSGQSLDWVKAGLTGTECQLGIKVFASLRRVRFAT